MALSAVVLDVLILVTMNRDQMSETPVLQLAINRTNARQISDWKFRLHLDTAEVPFTESLADRLAKYYYRTKPLNMPLIVISYTSALVLAPTTSILTGLSIPFFFAAGNFPEYMMNKARYPTILSTTAIENAVMLDFTRAILQNYNWTTVYLLCDTDETPPGNDFYQQLCQNFEKLLPREVFTVHQTRFSGRNQTEAGFQQLLSQVQRKARIIVLLADVHPARQLIVQAESLNFTRNGYVFFFMQPIVEPPWHPLFHWRHNDTFDALARDGFQSVFYIKADVSTLVKSLTPGDLDELNRQTFNSTTRKNLSRANIHLSTMSAYEAISMVRQKLGQLMEEGDPKQILSPWNGHLFTATLFNQTFNFPSGAAFINEKGCKVPNYILHQFDNFTGELQDVGYYDGKDKGLSFPFGRDIVWPHEIIPVNEPACGIDGDEGECAAQGSSRVTYIVIGVLLALILLVSAIMAQVIRQRLLASDWVFLKESELQLKVRRHRRDTFARPSFVSQTGTEKDLIADKSS